MNPVKSDNRDLPVETGIGFATVVDEVRRLVRRDRGEIESLLDLDRVPPDLFRELVERLDRDDAAAPDSNKLAGLDNVPSVDGLAAGNVTILDFTFVGKVSRSSLAHETSAYARRAGRSAVRCKRCPAAPGLTSARETPPTRRGAYENQLCPSTKKRVSINYWWTLG